MFTINVVNLAGAATGMVLIARDFGPELFGVYATISSLTFLVFGIFGISNRALITAFFTKFRASGELNKAEVAIRFSFATDIAMAAAAYLLLVVVVLLASDQIGFGDEHRVSAILFGIVGIGLAFDSDTLGLARLSGLLRETFFIALTTQVVRVVAIILVLNDSAGVREVTYVFVFTTLGQAALMLLVASAAVRRLSLSLRNVANLRHPFAVPREVIDFKLANTLDSGVRGGLRHIDVVIVAALAGSAAAGTYRAARQLISIPIQATGYIVIGVQPEISELWARRDYALLARFMRIATVAAFTASAVAFIIAALLMDGVVDVFLGSEFSEVSDVAIVLMIGFVALFTATPLALLHSGIGRLKPIVIATLIAGAVQLVLLSVLVPLVDEMGAAISLATFYGIYGLIVSLWAVKRIRDRDGVVQPATPAPDPLPPVETGG